MAGGVSKGVVNTKSVTKPVQQQQQQQPSGSPGGGYGGYGGYGGSRRRSSGGGGSSKPSKDDQKKQQATLNNLGDIYGRKKKDLEKQTAANLNVIKDKQKANNAQLKQQQIQIKKSSEWQPTQQKEQSTLTALRDRMGNSAHGSGIQDLMEGISRVDDMNDVQLINTYKQNTDNAYNNWFQADTELVGDYNEALADAEQKMGDLMNQYQAALNNVNPLAATTKNINKAAKKTTALSKVNENVKLAKAAQKKAAAYAKKNPNDKAMRALNKANVKLNKALKKQAKAKKKNSVSVGSGTSKVTLPKVNMSPSSAFSKLMANKAQNASAVNPLTKGYIRPDAATTSLGGTRGAFNTADDANSNFADNLNAFRHV